MSDPITHVPTAEDIARVKERVAAQANGAPVPPVFRKSFAEGKISFLYRWYSYGEYTNDILENQSYRAQAEKNPEEAQKYLRMKVFQKCVLWPETFNPLAREELQPYPAGVVGRLFDSIMETSGFTENVLPDTVVLAPDMPQEPTPEEVEALRLAHPLAKRFGVLGKPFFMESFNYETREPELVPLRYYLYCPIDRATLVASRELGEDDAAIDFVLSKATVWPQNIDWAQEPANYRDWVFNSILVASGCGPEDPSSGVEEV